MVRSGSTATSASPDRKDVSDRSVMSVSVAGVLGIGIRISP
jgi:hypothetical protein